jgi:hypothetical protein
VVVLSVTFEGIFLQGELGGRGMGDSQAWYCLGGSDEALGVSGGALHRLPFCWGVPTRPPCLSVLRNAWGSVNRGRTHKKSHAVEKSVTAITSMWERIKVFQCTMGSAVTQSGFSSASFIHSSRMIAIFFCCSVVDCRFAVYLAAMSLWCQAIGVLGVTRLAYS